MRYYFLCLTPAMYQAHIASMNLDQYISSHSLTNAEFASLIGRDTSTVSRLRKNKTLPDWATVAKIYKATNGEVSANDFLPTNRPLGLKGAV